MNRRGAGLSVRTRCGSGLAMDNRKHAGAVLQEIARRGRRRVAGADFSGMAQAPGAGRGTDRTMCWIVQTTSRSGDSRSAETLVAQTAGTLRFSRPKRRKKKSRHVPIQNQCRLPEPHRGGTRTRDPCPAAGSAWLHGHQSTRAERRRTMTLADYVAAARRPTWRNNRPAQCRHASCECRGGRRCMRVAATMLRKHDKAYAPNGRGARNRHVTAAD